MGEKLLYGLFPKPFCQYGTESGHMRLLLGVYIPYSNQEPITGAPGATLVEILITHTISKCTSDEFINAIALGMIEESYCNGIKSCCNSTMKPYCNGMIKRGRTRSTHINIPWVYCTRSM